MPARLVADRLSMRFGRRRLFDGLTLEVEAGAPVAITGANGSGKSTLLLILAGLVAPTGGTVRLGVDGAEVAPEELPRTVGFAAPSLQVYDALSARENLTFLASARSLPEAADRIARVLDRVGLGARADDLVSTFSTGMRQRLRLATALLHDPPVLLLDEPGATLDDAGRNLTQSIIADPEAVVVVATNDPAEAELCPRRVALGGSGL
ncbi:MAG: ABC transporter ATP-binding protein [Bacteroidota bacterium]